MAERDVNKANTVNSLAAGHIAKCSQKVGAKIVYFSTDYVFDGTKILI